MDGSNVYKKKRKKKTKDLLIVTFPHKEENMFIQFSINSLTNFNFFF